MSFLAHLAEGPIVIVSFFARLAVLPWGNCKTYSSSYSWWILCVSRVWSSPVDHVNAISKHVYGIPIFNKYIEANAKYFLLNYPNTVVWVMSWNFSPLPKEFSTLYHVLDIMLCLSLGRIYPWKYVFKHIFLSIVLFSRITTFSFPLFGLTFLVIYMT